MQEKIDAVNSYQPLQFAAQDPEIMKNRQELEKYSYKPSEQKIIYIEAMKIDSLYDSNSPVAKEKLVTNLVEKPFIGAVNPITDPSEFDDLVMEPELIDKKKVPFFSRAKWEQWKPILKGEPADDAFLYWMRSHHTDNNDTRNNKNDMVALQYGGISAGRFVNSWYRETLFLTFARRIWKKDLGHDFSVDLQYKAGIMHGYENKAPIRLGWVEPVIIPCIGLNYKTSGADIWIVPSNYPVFALNFRFGIPNALTYKSVHTKYRAKHPAKPKEQKPRNDDAYEQIAPEKI